MKKKILFPLLINISLFYLPLTVWGFDTKGHKAIESEAYRLLYNYPGSGTIPNGIQIIKFFTDRNILAGDFPNPHSQFPDLSLERQFAQNRQMYHFMASNHDVMLASGSKGEELQQQQLLLQALPPCLKMIYFF